MIWRLTDMSNAHQRLVNDIRQHAIVLKGGHEDYTRLLKLADNAEFVLIGEPTHGTEEFYRIRETITRLLIRHCGFTGVAIEADWPDTQRITRYLRGDQDIKGVHDALSGFKQFPSWLWRNHVTLEFLTWLHEFNRNKESKVGVYGLDFYNMYGSIHAVIDYLKKIDTPAARRAQQHYNCFDFTSGHGPEQYGFLAALQLRRSCERDVVEQLTELQWQKHHFIKKDGLSAQEDFFFAEQNARSIVDAEKYYRTLFQKRAVSWNLRDRHMADSLNALVEHLSARDEQQPKIVVWAHNSHVGDARATEMGDAGQWNLGQLVRQEHGSKKTVLIGFSTYQGEVLAADEWDGKAKNKILPPAMPESYEHLFHETGLKEFMLIMRDNEELNEHLRINRLQRGIGAIYNADEEKRRNYYYAHLPEQFDAIIHIDNTNALRSLDASAADSVIDFVRAG